MSDLDDSIVSAMLGLQGQEREHIGLIFQGQDGLQATPTQSTGQRKQVKGTLAVPTGSVRALFHNHPAVRDRQSLRDSGGGEQFSADDKAQARKLGVPSYILTPQGRVLKYDPTTDETTEVLSALPVRTSGAHNTLVK